MYKQENCKNYTILLYSSEKLTTDEKHVYYSHGSRLPASAGVKAGMSPLPGGR